MMASCCTAILVLVVAALAAPFGIAQEKVAEPAAKKADDVDALLAAVEAVRKGIQTIRANVRYNRTVEVLEIDEAFAGSLHFKVPRFLRMELKEVDGDKKRLYVIGKEYAWVYHPAKSLVERYYMGEVETKGPVQLKAARNPFEYGLAHGIPELKKTFTMRIAGAEKIGDRPTTILELCPKKELLAEGEDKGVKLMFWIDDKSALPVRVREFKSRGQKVETYTLTNVEVNPLRLWPALVDPFSFKPPRDAVVETFGDPEGERGKPK